MEVTQTFLAEFCEVSAPTIIKWRKSGMPCARPASRGGEANFYDSLEFLEWWGRRWAERNGLAGESDEDFDSERELALLRRSQRRLNEMKEAEQSGELIPYDEAVRAWSSVLTAFRSRILAVPPRMRSRMPDMPTEAYDELQHLLREALDELSRSDPISDQEVPRDSSATA